MMGLGFEKNFSIFSLKYLSTFWRCHFHPPGWRVLGALVGIWFVLQKYFIVIQSTPSHVNQMNTLKIRMEGILNCMRKLHNDENVESRRLCVQLITFSSHAMGGLWTVDSGPDPKWLSPVMSARPEQTINGLFFMKTWAWLVRLQDVPKVVIVNHTS